ncbi:peptide chain release factor N(5)-glutamine methyltransferase [Chryseobacterium sp. H3056]|uniref:peptide chain release factor N(5)-glutamine methyltransferase n=1 Tax=Kaistella daneshvariae TaxID=2487074 RepID=A0A3N0WUT6_9FLAO|nr:peptide chain release factor N(5)-glutamine methyltransferase [Kaistella daneshvariae]ROI08827.1 peptide chain release factor N(5)-glutamine methyltransferase [Kaistella daneshvariae]
MTLEKLKIYFINEISGQYSETESNLLFGIFVEKYLGLNTIEQRVEKQLKLSAPQMEIFEKAIMELKSGKPYQQILGETVFFGLKFFVDENVLIPRPETEELLELAIEKIKKNAGLRANFSVLDIGTGSGIIPIVLRKHFPEAQISALDFSEKALKTAQKNADFHQVEINFKHQNYLEENLTEVYDIIISNPPYIAIEEEDEIAASVKEFEPTMALFSPTSNALVFYEKIAKDCGKNLSANGMVFLEINQKLGKETAELFKNVLEEVHLLEDISGNERMVWGRKTVDS